MDPLSKEAQLRLDLTNLRTLADDIIKTPSKDIGNRRTLFLSLMADIDMQLQAIEAREYEQI